MDLSISLGLSPKSYISGFDPTLVSGCVGWYDAQDSQSVVEVSNLVSQWSDKSGEDNHLIQPTGSAQPLTGSSTISGFNTLLFDAVDDEMYTSSNPYGAVVSDAYVLCVYNTGSASDGVLFTLTGTDTVANRFSAHAPFSDLGLYFDCGGIVAPKRMVHANAFIENEDTMFGVYASTIDSVRILSKNGETLEYSAFSYDVSTVNNIYIASLNGGTFANFAIGEMVIYDGTVSEGDRQKLEGYMAHKWGLASLLPGDHPYKYTAPLL